MQHMKRVIYGRFKINTIPSILLAFRFKGLYRGSYISIQVIVRMIQNHSGGLVLKNMIGGHRCSFYFFICVE